MHDALILKMAVSRTGMFLPVNDSEGFALNLLIRMRNPDLHQDFTAKVVDFQMAVMLRMLV